jgi:carotenoid cleavage dioxygenase-like enzyme
MVHDFALTPTKAIFVVAPCALPRVPLGLILGQKSFGESLRFTPEQGTHVAVVDRKSGEVRWYAGDAFMLFHTIQAWDDGEDTIVDVCAYPDGKILQSLTDVMSGTTPTMARAWPERIVLGKDGMKRTRLAQVSLEFPRIDDSLFGAPARKAYGVTWPNGSPFLKTPAVVDLATGHAELAPLAAGEFAGELVPVPKKDGGGDWLLSLVLDATKERSVLHVYDGANISAGAVAKATLPHVVPFGFHGNFTPLGS